MENIYSFKIVQNPSGSYCIKEYKLTVRSPFDTVEEARQREFEIMESYGYKKSEVTEIK